MGVKGTKILRGKLGPRSVLTPDNEERKDMVTILAKSILKAC